MIASLKSRIERLEQVSNPGGRWLLVLKRSGEDDEAAISRTMLERAPRAVPAAFLFVEQ